MEPLYYLLFEERQCGPYRADELLEAGLEDDTLVWYVGREGWVRADKLVKLHDLLTAGRKAHKQRRKIQRQVVRLPEPETLRKLARASFVVNLAAGLLYVAGTALLIPAFVLLVRAAARGGALTIAETVVPLLGLAASGLGSVLLMVELGLLAAFVWNCSRIVQVISPRGEKSQIQFSEAEDLFKMSVLLSAIALLLCGLLTLVFAFVFIVIFLVLYVVLAFSLYRLGYGLNRVINDCNLKVPWAPVTLAFWVGLCALLLALGPLSVPLFVLVPIWTHKTACTAIAICEQRFAAADEPAYPVEQIPPPLPRHVVEGPDIV